MLQSSPVFPYVPAIDMERAQKFYESTLGFTPGGEIPGGGLTYECAGETAFFLYPTPNAGTNKASTLFWQVDDIRAEVENLKAKGVEFEEYDMPVEPQNSIYIGFGSKIAWFKDSEENVLALVEEGED
jgi:predicted enzyme related to lactoylglutathione lyase